MKYTIDFSQKVRNQDMDIVESLDMFTITKQLLGMHTRGGSDLVWDILFLFKENETTKKIPLTEKEIEFLVNDVIHFNEGTYAYMKEQLKRFLLSGKEEKKKIESTTL